MLGLITGSGFTDIPQLTERRSARHETPYGEAAVTFGVWRGGHDPDPDPGPGPPREVVVLARHGADHSLPPQGINYRANVWALHDLGVEGILATAVSGGIAPHLVPGTLVLIDDFLDFTSGRASTFFDESVHHTDMTSAYDRQLRAVLAEAARIEGIDVIDGGTYCAFNGPRFESPAEIKMASVVGGHLVGMTGYPEVALARELSVPYAAIGVISNPAAGLGGADLSLTEIMATLAATADRLLRLIGRTIQIDRSS